MDRNRGELTRAVATYLSALGFVVAFLVATFCGAALGTSLLRGVIVLGVAWFITPFFVRPVLDAIFDGIAQDRARRAAEENADGELAAGAATSAEGDER